MPGNEDEYTGNSDWNAPLGCQRQRCTMAAMATVTFDTQKYADTLLAAGVPVEQVKAFVNAQRAMLAEMADSSDIATKADLMQLKMATKAELLELKVDMVKWMVGLALAQVALLVGILFKLPH
jgi:hypothetical protein